MLPADEIWLIGWWRWG